MNQQQRVSLQAYIGDVAEELELNDWRISVDDEVPDPRPNDDEPALAQVIAAYARRLAAVRVCPDFFELEPRVQRATIVHELVHLHFEAAWNYAHDGVRNLVAPSAFEAYKVAMCMHLEYGIDAVALAFAEKLPLPVGLSATSDTVKGSRTKGARHGKRETEGGRAPEPQEGTRRSPRSKGQAA